MIERLLALEQFGIKLGLQNIQHLCEALGHPERSFHTVHVAGTNGKGSVTAMVHEMIMAAGYRSARYTSPHLSDLRERFVIGHEMVSAEHLDAAGTRVLDCADRLVESGILHAPPTFFEAATAIAFELFRRASVEVAVIEVGLGGRFDATNVVSPSVGAITSIGFDHRQHLGDTLADIAFEKAGIVKPGMTVVAGPLPAEADDVVARAAHGRHATLIRCTDDVVMEASFESGAVRLTLKTPCRSYGPVTLGLRGRHQTMNALVAVRVAEALSAAGFAIDRHAIEHGLRETHWPARLESVGWPDGSRQILMDAAHNPDGARALADYLGQWHPERPPLVVGLMRDKDAAGILDPLLPVTSVIVCTAAPTPRALPPTELAELIRTIDPTREVLVASNPGDAIDVAFEHGPTVCVAGSIFLAGAVRDVLIERAILR